jgi:hypothetical protein
MLLKVLAGYRNRMVHFYHEVTPNELYEICRSEFGDIQRVKEVFVSWINAHPDYMDDTLQVLRNCTGPHINPLLLPKACRAS